MTARALGTTISINKACRLAGAVAAPLLIAGCGMPIGIQIASFLADTVSVITTDKTLTDHGISSVTQKDCSLWRSVEGTDICREPNNSITNMADASSLPAAVGTKDKSPELNRGATATSETINKNLAWRKTTEFSKEEPAKAVAPLPSPSTHAPKVIPTQNELKAWTQITAEVIVPETQVQANNIAVTPAAVTVPKSHKSPTYMTPKTNMTAPVKSHSAVKSTSVAEPINKSAAPVQPSPLNTRQTFFIIASYHYKAAASRFSGKHNLLKPTIMEGTAHGKQVYRVAIGPVSRDSRKTTLKVLKNHGFGDAWALTVRMPKLQTEVATLR